MARTLSISTIESAHESTQSKVRSYFCSMSFGFYDSGVVGYYMGLRDPLRRFNQWTEGLSRVGYAILGAVVAILVSVAVQLLFFDEFRVGTVVGLAIGISVVNYAMGKPSSR